ncbi:MAG: hypothetical protein F4060_01735 [Holophagales bacterium]|nr:hypothetical protein [Holophagales bacterium]MYG29962.1 hypothetical protein [Holophagales bacterium]MYI78641.1 hypothetical protein [Holophagales bacterium]
MPPHSGPVLVDTNVIFECHRTDSWRALTSGYRLETTEDCVAETQAGKQNRERRTEVDETRLRQALSAVHSVSDRLHEAYTEAWHRRAMNELVVELGP